MIAYSWNDSIEWVLSCIIIELWNYWSTSISDFIWYNMPTLSMKCSYLLFFAAICIKMQYIGLLRYFSKDFCIFINISLRFITFISLLWFICHFNRPSIVHKTNSMLLHCWSILLFVLLVHSMSFRKCWSFRW